MTTANMDWEDWVDGGPEPECEVCGDQGGNGEPCPKCKRAAPYRAPRPALRDDEPF